MKDPLPHEQKPDLVTPRTDEDFFAIGRLLLSRSTCLKTQTAAMVVSGATVVSWGVNMCCPQDQLYGLPVSSCPRKDAQTGTHYELCKPIHAEIVAAINAFGISHVDRKSLWHFPGFTLRLLHYKDFFRGKDTRLYLLGHYWACQECVDFLKHIGITEIRFDDLSGGKTLREYKVRELTDKHRALDVSGAIMHGVVSVKIAPADAEEFCRRAGISLDSLRPFPVFDPQNESDVYLLQVAVGHERERAHAIQKDPAVKTVALLSIESL